MLPYIIAQKDRLYKLKIRVCRFAFADSRLQIRVCKMWAWAWAWDLKACEVSI